MKRALLVVFLLLIATSATFAQQSYVAVDEEDANVTENVASEPSRTIRQKSQVTIRRDKLTANDLRMIDKATKSHVDKKSQANNTSYRDGLKLLREMKIIHPSKKGTLDRSPNDIHWGYQIVTELANRLVVTTDQQIQPPAPIQKLELPAFAGGSIPDLALQECSPFEQPREREKSLCVVPQGPAGAVAISHPGDRQESAIAYGSKSWTKIPQPKCIVKPPTPPVVGPCPPGPPPSKPPTSAPVGNPSGINPGGPPASGGPPPPSGNQGPVVIGNPSVTWGPTPTHRNVADRVTP